MTPVVYTYLDPYNRRLERKLARDKRKQVSETGQIDLALPGAGPATGGA